MIQDINVQHELLKSALSATDNFLNVESKALIAKSANTVMLKDFINSYNIAWKALEALGVLDQHEAYLKDHLRTMWSMAKEEDNTLADDPYSETSGSTGADESVVLPFSAYLSEKKSEESCPLATHDLDLNVKNRQVAIDKYTYGPANPDKPGAFWLKIADIWGIKEQEAKTMRCGNCSAFNVSDSMRKCISDGINEEDSMAVIEKADLGYCEILHFKCAGTRTCELWLTGGPLDDKDL
ncbi:MAG: hypothetical protein ACO294_07610 [Methylococcales bacterium]|jgi:hypothetical protein